MIIIQPGIAYSSAGITEELRYYNLPQADYNSKWSSTAWGPCFQFTFSPVIQTGEFDVSLEGGYRFSWYSASEQKIESSTGNSNTYDHIEIGQNGLIFLVTLEMNL